MEMSRGAKVGILGLSSPFFVKVSKVLSHIYLVPGEQIRKKLTTVES